MSELGLQTSRLELVLESTGTVVARIEAMPAEEEAAAALVAFAYASGVRCVRAHTLPQAGPSTSVLLSCGFRQAGEVVDPEDGVVWRWEHMASHHG